MLNVFPAPPVLAVHERGWRELLRGFWVRHVGVRTGCRAESLHHEACVSHPLATGHSGFSTGQCGALSHFRSQNSERMFVGPGHYLLGYTARCLSHQRTVAFQEKGHGGGVGVGRAGEYVLGVSPNLPSSFSHILLDLGIVQNLLFWLHSFHQLKCSWQPDPCE